MTGVYNHTHRTFNYIFNQEQLSLILVVFSALTCYNLLPTDEQQELKVLKQKLISKEALSLEELKTTIFLLEKIYESNVLGSYMKTDAREVIQAIRSILESEENK